LYALLGKSYALKYIGFNLPRHLTKRDALLSCEIIKKARSQFEKCFKSKGFGVIMYPCQDGPFTPMIIDVLQKAGIKCLDYSKLYTLSDQKKYAVHPNFDLHPNRFGYELVAKKFERDIREVFPF
jgi:hypothetical protein